MPEFKFKIGEFVQFRQTPSPGTQPNGLLIVYRRAVECTAGIQNEYAVRGVVNDDAATTGYMWFNEVELEPFGEAAINPLLAAKHWFIDKQDFDTAAKIAEAIREVKKGGPA